MSFLAIVFILVVVFVGGQVGVYALVGISGCMSLMFPTIFGLSVEGLVSTVVDKHNAGSGIQLPPDINMAYLVPMLCFVFIAYYALYANRRTA